MVVPRGTPVYLTNSTLGTLFALWSNVPGTAADERQEPGDDRKGMTITMTTMKTLTALSTLGLAAIAVGAQASTIATMASTSLG